MQSADEDGGPKQQLTLFEQPPREPADALTAEERLFEDETDSAADRNQLQRAAGANVGTIRRAHAVTRDDDLLPAF
jgi:type IV secretion system protein VirD4